MREVLMGQPLTEGDLISTAAIIAGFGITVFVFRIQREVAVLDIEPKEGEKKLKAHISWADGLIIISVYLALVSLGALLWLHDRFGTMKWVPALCIAAVALQLFYIPAILSHYGIGM